MLDKLRLALPDYSADLSDPFDALRCGAGDCLATAVCAFSMNPEDNVLVQHTASNFFLVPSFRHFVTYSKDTGLITESTGPGLHIATREPHMYGEDMSERFKDVKFDIAGVLLQELAGGSVEDVIEERTRIRDGRQIVRVARIDPERLFHNIGLGGSVENIADCIKQLVEYKATVRSS